MYVCMYVCMYTCMYDMYVCMYVCMYKPIYLVVVQKLMSVRLVFMTVTSMPSVPTLMAPLSANVTVRRATTEMDVSAFEKVRMCVHVISAEQQRDMSIM